jgi:tripartite-type tricarboxylate transporter receptor subunit TctC
MLSSEVELPMTAVPYDGDGPAQTALMGGAVNVLPAVLGAAIENVKAGRVKAIAIIDTERNPLLPDVPAIVEDYPDFAQYLPWGPFFGIFVKEGTPEEAVTKLQAAFRESAEQPDFKALMDARGFVQMNISGEEAEEFLDRWQSVTSWLVFDAGIAKSSPEEFGIPRP